MVAASSLPLPDFVSEGLEMFHLLRELVDRGDVVILFWDGRDYQLTLGRRTFERGGLAEAIRDAARDFTPTRRCTQCGHTKALHEFPRDRSRPTEHFHACYVCERVRWRDVKRAARARRAKAAGRVPRP